MTRQCCALAAALMALAPYAGRGDAPVILPTDDGRIWQTVFDPSAPLEWRWVDGAESATVTVTNALFGTVDAPIVVARTVNAKYGSVAMPNPARSADTGEGLVDVVLVQLDSGDNVLSSECARLAFLPGADGGAFTVNARQSMESPRVVPYDAAWTNAAVSTVACTFAPDDGAAQGIPLTGLSGYFPFAPADGTLSLLFDGDAYAEAQTRIRRGVMLIVH